MKKWSIILLSAFFLSFSFAAQAQTNPLAIGIRISNRAPVINTSVLVRYYVNDQHAIEGLVSFDPVAIGGLYEVFKPLGKTPGFSWFYGAGAYVGFSKSAGGGAQGVLGLDYNVPNLPLNFSLDWKPELSVAPVVNFEPAAVGFSVRFMLNKSTK